jgi:hypothetical protein
VYHDTIRNKISFVAMFHNVAIYLFNSTQPGHPLLVTSWRQTQPMHHLRWDEPRYAFINQGRTLHKGILQYKNYVPHTTFNLNDHWQSKCYVVHTFYIEVCPYVEFYIDLWWDEPWYTFINQCRTLHKGKLQYKHYVPHTTYNLNDHWQSKTTFFHI